MTITLQQQQHKNQCDSHSLIRTLSVRLKNKALNLPMQWQ